MAYCPATNDELLPTTKIEVTFYPANPTVPLTLLKVIA